MAAVTVFIDDAVRGNLPGICAKSAEPTTRHMTITEDMSGSLGALWLAVLFGPVGWLVLVLVALSRRRSNLTVRLPYSTQVLGWYTSAVREMYWCIGGTVAALGLCVAASVAIPIVDGSTAWIAAMAVLVVGVVATAVCRWRALRLLVGLTLDASGRWVTLHDVHPVFAEACTAAERRYAADRNTARL